MHRPRLILPLAGLAATLGAGPMLATVALAADPTVIVRPGDTLTAVARRHEVDVATLVDLNDLRDPNLIHAGQRLRIGPGPAQAAVTTMPAEAPAAARSHTVASGENLTVIARQHGVTVEAIVRANGIADPSRILAGQRIAIPREAPVAAPARTRIPASMAALVDERHAVRLVIVEEANRRGVPAALALAVAWQESGWQQAVVSDVGAVGVMQLMPDTAEWVATTMLGTTARMNDTRWNVRAGARLLAHYIDRYDGDRDRVLAAYYQGQAAVDRHGIYPATRPYIASIKALERIFGG